MGDTLFAMVNVARWMGLDPESALRLANQRFRARFRRMGGLAQQRGAGLRDMSLDQMDELWELAKQEDDRS
jgi:uncharacterized protein YabN with tetrapyrrole methylase and pyrophosphatase domain